MFSFVWYWRKNNSTLYRYDALTNAVPASAARAERKLKDRAAETLNPDLTKMPKSPICKRRGNQCGNQQIQNI